MRTPALLLTLIVAAGGLGLAAQQPAAFRSGVDMVALTVTVTGPDGKYVRGLDRADFTVLEDGVPQDVVLFDRDTIPLAVSLVLDSSASMINQLALAQQAATEFVARLRPDDVVQIIDFDSSVRVLQPFTSDRRALERALRQPRADGATSLHEAVATALAQLDEFRTQGGGLRREVILVLSDGADNSRSLRFDPLLALVRRAPGVIYTIGLGLHAPPFMGFTQWAANSEANLRRLAQETGGRLMVASEAADLAGVYSEIADELNNQYLLGYAAPEPDRPGWRSISVAASPTLEVRTRTGYDHVPRSRM